MLGATWCGVWGFGVKGTGLRLQGFVQIKGVWLRL